MAYLSQTNKSLLEFSSADICNSIDNLADKIDSGIDLNTIFDAIYPIGSIYISTNNTNPGSFFKGVWESVGSGRCLMGVDANHAANTTAEAGLPNITGKKLIGWTDGSATMSIMNPTYKEQGALYSNRDLASGSERYSDGGFPAVSGHDTTLNFDASRSSSVYGKSSTVQPPAYYVYMWRRIG